MSACSAAEIAEKKRLAQERLRARKLHQQQTIPKGNVGEVSPNLCTSSTAGAAISFPGKPGSTFYSSPSGQRKATLSRVENKASAFLNALKQSSAFEQRKMARDGAHPYQRPESSAKGAKLRVTPEKKLAPVFGRTISCDVYLVSKYRFAANPSGYHTQLINIFKEIPSKNYDSNSRIWSFALKDYRLLRERVSALKPDVTIGSIPKGIIDLCQAPPKPLDRSCLASIESTLADKLMPFQQDGVCFAIAEHGRVMICDEMGLGKTYQALAVADFYKEDWPLLICTTASTRESWGNHVRELLPSIPVHYVQTLSNNQQYFGDAKVLITSYNMMEKHFTRLIERNFGFLIFDESHTLKNSKAKCTVVADRLAKKAKHIVLLSGTPALSRPLELFSQLQMVDRKFMNFIEFTTRYCDGKQTNFGWVATGQSNLEELNVVLTLKYMLRRTKAEVLPQLAEKSRETVLLDPALIWQKNDDTKETLDNYTRTFSISKGKQREEILLKFYAQTAEVKTRAVCAYLKTLLKENVKFIVFAHHRIMLNAITDCLEKLKANYVRIDGSTRNDIRAEYVNIFQKKSSCKVALLSLKACNSGITLTAAEMIVFAELDWNPATLAQAESRAHRIGQLKPVICRYLMASKTADDIIWNMLKSKQDVLNRAGLFCEDLQKATHSVAPTISAKIEQYFSPNEKNAFQNDTTAKAEENEVLNADIAETKQAEPNIFDNCDLSKELANIEDFFMDDSQLIGNSATTASNMQLQLDSVEKDSDFSKELANIEHFFEDVTDDAFNDLAF